MIKKTKGIKAEMDSLIDRTRDAVVDVADRAEHGVDSAAENVAGRAHTAGNAVRDGAEAAARSAHARLRTAAKAIDRGYDRAQHKLSRAVATTTFHVREHPGRVILLAAGAGFVLGALVPRRRVSA